MDDTFEKAGQEAAAFQKVWLENCSKIMQAAFQFTPDSAPPDVLRQVRTGIFQTLTESWDKFLRSPEFLDGMRQWMDNAIAFRKISNEFMGRVRNDMQAPSCNDIDTVMQSVRHMEKRLLDRLDEIAAHLTKSEGRQSPRKRSSTPKSKARVTGSFRRQKDNKGKTA
jgi:hypothetical protein